MAIGLTFDEYVELRLTPRGSADPTFQQAAEIERDAMFPLNIGAAANHLRSRGYDCRPEMLDLLVKNGVVKLDNPDRWDRADVDAAAEYFEEAGIFVAYAAMCQALGCNYADFLRPLQEAAEREAKHYGCSVPEDDQYFVMHRVPPRGVTNESGDLVSVTLSVISFTLCDDVRERLERGEEV